MTDSRPRNALWAAYEYLAMALGLGTLALICLLWLPFAMLLDWLLPRRIGQPLGRFVARICFRVYLGILGLLCACRFDLDDLERLRDEGPLVLVANHPSLLDAVLVLARVPNTCLLYTSRCV